MGVKSVASFFMKCSGSDGTEERVALYERAANCFKMAHKWKEAGDAFVQAAELIASNDFCRTLLYNNKKFLWSAAKLTPIVVM